MTEVVDELEVLRRDIELVIEDTLLGVLLISLLTCTFVCCTLLGVLLISLLVCKVAMP